jgi:integrase
VDQLLDRYFDMADLERNTIEAYRGYAEKHILPLIGTVKVGELGGEIFDSLYAELRRCRDHCDRRPHIDHRTSRPHDCDERCSPHVCKPLSPSTVRQIHFIVRASGK